MSDLTLNIADLKAKVEKLVTLHKAFKEENEKLTLEVSDFKKTIENQTIKIQQLENENKELSIKKDEEKNDIVTNTKEKINELVQEIDDCIALLNK
jgi:regulator of replication initiation timing